SSRPPAISTKLWGQTPFLKAKPSRPGLTTSGGAVQASVFDLFADHEIGRELPGGVAPAESAVPSLCSAKNHPCSAKKRPCSEPKISLFGRESSLFGIRRK